MWRSCPAALQLVHANRSRLGGVRVILMRRVTPPPPRAPAHTQAAPKKATAKKAAPKKAVTKQKAAPKKAAPAKKAATKKKAATAPAKKATTAKKAGKAPPKKKVRPRGFSPHLAPATSKLSHGRRVGFY